MSDSAAHRDRDCPVPPPRAPPVRNLVGLALSGGGIRSASFNLGVLQGLQSRGALWIFDYLSTVSGGGFIGSWWSAWLSRERRCRIDFDAEIELPIDEFATISPDDTTDTHVVRGTIAYLRPHLQMLGIDPDADPKAARGKIIWIKRSVTALDAADVRQYQLAHRDFPQQSHR